MIFSIKAKSPKGIKAQIGTQRNKGKTQLECMFSTAVYVPALGLLRLFLFSTYESQKTAALQSFIFMLANLNPRVSNLQR